MNLIDFSKQLEEFYSAKKDEIKNIWSLLDKAKENFFLHFDSIDSTEFKYISYKSPTLSPILRNQQMRNKLRDDIETINASVLTMVGGDINKALDDFYKVLFPNNKCIAKPLELKAGYPFYRMRSAEKYEIFDRKSMFLHSFDSLSKIGLARYNRQGFPCLYLASSLYVCWEELRRPDFSKVNFSLFKNRRSVMLLDITIAVKCNNYGKFLMAYLSLLCGCSVEDDQNSYKFEYDVPNMVFYLLIMNNKKNGIIDGIRYMSSKRYYCTNLQFSYNRSIMYAYVFPVKKISKEEYCLDLCNLFRLTKGYTYFLYKIHSFIFYKDTAWTTNYKSSLFYDLEQQLQKEKLKSPPQKDKKDDD